MADENIKAWQELLKNGPIKTYSGDVDGLPSDSLTSAIQAFQSELKKKVPDLPAFSPSTPVSEAQSALKLFLEPNRELGISHLKDYLKSGPWTLKGAIPYSGPIDPEINPALLSSISSINNIIKQYVPNIIDISPIILKNPQASIDDLNATLTLLNQQKTANLRRSDIKRMADQSTMMDSMPTEPDERNDIPSAIIGTVTPDASATLQTGDPDTTQQIGATIPMEIPSNSKNTMDDRIPELAKLTEPQIWRN